MEDDNGLELSLGLTFGGLSGKSKGKTGSSSDNRTEEGDRGNKLVDDFKNFLNAGTQKQDTSSASQRSDSVKPKENFFKDLSKANAEGDASVDLNGKGFFEEEKRSEAGSKRRMFFDELSQPKKHEREGHFADINEKTRVSHISLTTEDGSTAENEDVADSEVEGSTSRLVLQHDDSSKRSIGISGSSDAQKEIRGIPEAKTADLSGQKRFNGSSENGYNKLGNISYGSHFPGQPVNMLNVPFSLPMKDGNSAAAPSASAHLLPGVMQGMPTANSEGPGTHPVYHGNLPLMFGYSPVQIPLLDKDNSWGLVSQPLQFHPSFAGRGPPNSALMQVIPHNASDAAQQDGRASDRTKADGKQHVGEEGSSTHAEEDGKGSSSNLRVKDASDRSTSDGSSLEFLAIKPGILADVKFGGSGSCPNLPWVSTTGPGPNGRTISGVTYRYNANQIRIVCACHGTHMSAEEFVRHASEDPGNNPENGAGLATFPNTNPAASAQS